MSMTKTTGSEELQLAPRRPPALAEPGKSAQAIRSFGGVTAELTFLEDGLHAVLTIQRK